MVRSRSRASPIFAGLHHNKDIIPLKLANHSHTEQMDATNLYKSSTEDVGCQREFTNFRILKIIVLSVKLSMHLTKAHTHTLLGGEHTSLGCNMIDIEVSRCFASCTPNLIRRDLAAEYVCVVLLREDIAVVNEDDPIMSGNSYEEIY